MIFLCNNFIVAVLDALQNLFKPTCRLALFEVFAVVPQTPFVTILDRYKHSLTMRRLLTLNE